MRNDPLSRGETSLGTNRAEGETNPANLGTDPPRSGTNRRREPVVRGLKAGRAGGPTRGCSTEMTLVIARALPPSAACRSRARRFNRSCQPPHQCRPQVQRSRRPTAPELNRFYLSIVLSSPLLPSSNYLLGTPRGPIRQSGRSQLFVRDFRPLIPALSGRRLHGRLGY